MAAGSGAQVVVLDRNIDALRRIDARFGARATTVFSNRDNIERHVLSADLVIGGVLIPGAAAPKLVSRQMVSAMKPGAVVVDVAIDQGGCFETSHPTTHADPTYVVDGVIHYCVANMPGGVPRTSTFAVGHFSPCPMCSCLPTRASGGRLRTILTCVPGSTSARARSPAWRSLRHWASPTMIHCRFWAPESAGAAARRSHAPRGAGMP